MLFNNTLYTAFTTVEAKSFNEAFCAEFMLGLIPEFDNLYQLNEYERRTIGVPHLILTIIYNNEIVGFKKPKGSIVIYNTHGVHRAKPSKDKSLVRKSLFFQVDFLETLLDYLKRHQLISFRNRSF